LAAILLLALPAIALANHQFSDVPTSSPYHTAISRLVESGITAGCGSGRFCPATSVTREQMAAFLTRGLGRSALGSGAVTFADSATLYTTTVQISTGGASGGTGFVTAAASVSAFTDVPGLCPCRGTAFLVDLATDEFSQGTLFVISASGFGDDTWGGSASSHWAFSAPSNSSRTYGLAVVIETTGTPPASVDGGTSGLPPGENAIVFGSITAEYSPFGSVGGSTLGIVGTTAVPWGETRPNERQIAPAD